MADVVDLETLPDSDTTTTVLVKKDVYKVENILQDKPNLCHVNKEKYTSPLPVAITSFVRKQLFGQGYLTQNQAKFVNEMGVNIWAL